MQWQLKLLMFLIRYVPNLKGPLGKDHAYRITTFFHVAFLVKDICLLPFKSCAFPCGSDCFINNWLLFVSREPVAESSV